MLTSATAPEEKKAAPAKRRRGRPRMSQGSRLVSSMEIDSMHGSPMVDLDISMHSVEDVAIPAKDKTPETPTPSVQTTPADRETERSISQSQSSQSSRSSKRRTRLSQIEFAEDTKIEESRILETSSASAMVSTSDKAASPAAEAVEETILGGTGLLAFSSIAVKLERDIIEAVTPSVTETPLTNDATEPNEELEAAEVVEETIVPEVADMPTADSIREKLESLIDDLGKAALSRAEVNRIEDMFMDAKEQLFGAGRRGRESHQQ